MFWERTYQPNDTFQQKVLRFDLEQDKQEDQVPHLRNIGSQFIALDPLILSRGSTEKPREAYVSGRDTL